MGAFLMSRAVLPTMIANGGGSIIHIASQLGRVAAPRRAADLLVERRRHTTRKAMAVDHASENIWVNALSPAAVETRRLVLRFGDMETAYTRTLQLVGTGYRAELKGQVLNLSLGFSHPIAYPLPQGLKCEIPGDSKGTLLVLTCSDKEVIGQSAAKIRAFRPPEPYGGKGVRYQGEKVREKAGKAAKAGGK